MTLLPILLFVHILLMVFWLGTDVGVFGSALRYIDAARPIAERKAVMDFGIVIDRFPRVCFVAMLPVGLQISQLLGILPIPAWAMVLAWATSAVWTAIVAIIIGKAGAPGARPFQMAERVLLVTVGLALWAAGLAGLDGMLEVPGWYAGKLIAFGCICFFGLVLDHSFGPVVSAFAEIEAQGSTPARETVLTRRMWVSLRWVLSIYAAVLVAGFLGVVQP
ncbi:hypothetical protein [Novosphingobium resinovorum]|uniref:hypothetical protein n=1 Tax=Novosphingobium resinovorum TaxID=158500 RepID=UPI002ED118AE|nr:hypothetical protein [Novosphingobium resinovorum]